MLDRNEENVKVNNCIATENTNSVSISNIYIFLIILLIKTSADFFDICSLFLKENFNF